MVALKPCPFCGGEVHLNPNICGMGDDMNPLLDYTVICWKCDFSFVGLNFTKSEKEIIEIWNRRSEENDCP